VTNEHVLKDDQRGSSTKWWEGQEKGPFPPQDLSAVVGVTWPWICATSLVSGSKLLFFGMQDEHPFLLSQVFAFPSGVFSRDTGSSCFVLVHCQELLSMILICLGEK
jgi:hypothetical protein